MSELYIIPLALSLLVAALSDIRTHTVKDKVWVYPFVVSLLIALATNGVAFMGSMIVQAALMLGLGFGIALATKFGGADIIALGVIGAMFPEILFLRLAAWLLVPVYLYMKVYSFVFRKDAVPIIPAFLLGTILLFFLFL